MEDGDDDGVGIQAGCCVGDMQGSRGELLHLALAVSHNLSLYLDNLTLCI